VQDLSILKPVSVTGGHTDEPIIVRLKMALNCPVYYGFLEKYLNLNIAVYYNITILYFIPVTANHLIILI